MISSRLKNCLWIIVIGEQLTHAKIMPGKASDPISHQSVPFVLRGGASESAASWSAGSKYKPYRSTPSSSRMKYETPRMNVENAKVKTKEVFAEAFLRREDRNRFIARVYAILSGQLLVTAGTIHAFHMNPTIRYWMMWNSFGRKGLLISTISWWITLSFEDIRRTSIMQMPLLVAFTIGQSIAVGFISSTYAYSSVIKAMITTATATLSISLYTLVQKNPRYDLSQWGRALSGLGTAFLLYGLIHVLELFGVLPHGFLPYTEAMYGLLGAGLFSLYLAHHTRLIVSGKSAKFQLNEKDFILGAMSVYSDIINVFLYVLRLLGEFDDRDER